MTAKRVGLVCACVALLYVYQSVLIWGTGLALSFPIPLVWSASFPTTLSGTLTWMVLVHTMAVVLVSVPFALVLARFGGSYAPTIALGMTVALFLVFSFPSLVLFFPTLPHRQQVVTAFDQAKLLGTLPLLVWLMRKLPSNYAFERTVKPPRNHRRLRAAAQRER